MLLSVPLKHQRHDIFFVSLVLPRQILVWAACVARFRAQTLGNLVTLCQINGNFLHSEFPFCNVDDIYKLGF